MNENQAEKDFVKTEPIISEGCRSCGTTDPSNHGEMCDVMGPYDGDYCLLCGQPVEDWRHHMDTKHHSVLKESPLNEDGTWKPIDRGEKCPVHCITPEEKTLEEWAHKVMVNMQIKIAELEEQLKLRDASLKKSSVLVVQGQRRFATLEKQLSDAQLTIKRLKMWKK